MQTGKRQLFQCLAPPRSIASHKRRGFITRSYIQVDESDRNVDSVSMDGVTKVEINVRLLFVVGNRG